MAKIEPTQCLSGCIRIFSTYFSSWFLIVFLYHFNMRKIERKTTLTRNEVEPPFKLRGIERKTTLTRSKI